MLCATIGASPTHCVKLVRTSAAVGALATSSVLMPWTWWPTIRRPGLTRDSNRSDLAVAHAQGGEVDDVAVLGLHRRRLEVEDHELVAAFGEQLAELDHRVGLGADERLLLRVPAEATSFSCRSIDCWSSAWP